MFFDKPLDIDSPNIAASLKYLNYSMCIEYDHDFEYKGIDMWNLLKWLIIDVYF